MSAPKKLCLPPGQRRRDDFPRFGLPKYTDRFPTQIDRCTLNIVGDVDEEFTIADELTRLPRIEQISDFHCVTTWSCTELTWGGYRFSDFFKSLIEPYLVAKQSTRHVILRCQDGYRASFLLEDLLQPDVLLADTLDGEKLPIAHGAPLRLIAPAHYGYKNVKHVSSIEFRENLGQYRSASLKFMEHPRARVAYEERGRWIPGWILRRLYRPLIGQTVKAYRDALNTHMSSAGKCS